MFDNQYFKRAINFLLLICIGVVIYFGARFIAEYMTESHRAENKCFEIYKSKYKLEMFPFSFLLADYFLRRHKADYYLIKSNKNLLYITNHYLYYQKIYDVEKINDSNFIFYNIVDEDKHIQIILKLFLLENQLAYLKNSINKDKYNVIFKVDSYKYNYDSTFIKCNGRLVDIIKFNNCDTTK